MQAYTRLTAQRRFSFRTKHYELNTRLYGRVFSRILDSVAEQVFDLNCV